MKATITSLVAALTIATSAQASLPSPGSQPRTLTKLTPPNIVCDLENYSTGVRTSQPLAVTMEKRSVETEGFKMTAKLEPVCAPGGGCTNNYFLNITLESARTRGQSTTLRMDSENANTLYASTSDGVDNASVRCGLNR